MSGKGNCYDNAVCESFFHTLKVEQVYRQSYQIVEEAGTSIFWYIEAYYNLRRKHSYLGYKSPVEFEKMQPKPALFTGTTGLIGEIEKVSKKWPVEL